MNLIGGIKFSILNEVIAILAFLLFSFMFGKSVVTEPNKLEKVIALFFFALWIFIGGFMACSVIVSR